MASSYSPSLKIELIGNGDQSGTWGTTTNNNLGTILEQAITGVQTITMVNADYTLTSFNGVSDEARNAVLVATGTNSAIRQIICPLVEKLYVIYNNTSGGFAITIGGVTGSTVTVPNGVTAQVYCDGINFFSSQTGSAGNFNVNGALTVAGTTTLAGATTLSSTLAVTGTTTFTGIPSGPTAAQGTNTTQLATTAFVQANSAPTGGLIMWPTGTAPTGWLLCTGTAVSRTTYAALFAIVGTTFGAGDGSTTFNLPNYTNRMPYGAAVGTTGGTADAIVVSHTHTYSGTTGNDSPDHTHLSNAVGLAGGANINWVGTGGAAYRNANDTQTGGASTRHQHPFSGTTDSTGSSGTNANLPPYLGINFIIKT
jgi:microcystin-dependent protein